MTQTLSKYIPKQLIYSTRYLDRMTNEEFHQRVDGSADNIIILAKLKSGNVVGGYRRDGFVIGNGSNQVFVCIYPNCPYNCPPLLLKNFLVFTRGGNYMEFS